MLQLAEIYLCSKSLISKSSNPLILKTCHMGSSINAFLCLRVVLYLWDTILILFEAHFAIKANYCQNMGKRLHTIEGVIFFQMLPEFDYGAIECVHEMLFNRTFLGQIDHPLNKDYYRNMVSVSRTCICEVSLPTRALILATISLGEISSESKTSEAGIQACLWR